MHPDAISLPSPAKINLFLHIIGRRADGYHLLQTLFQFLDYGDTLHFCLRQDGQIKLSCDPLLNIPEEENLIWRAASTLQHAANIGCGVDIVLDKHLPLGGGLGGGSSNAATTLWALNELWQLHWTPTQLMELGLRLGADIPFFLYGHAAWGEGVGDQLSPAQPQEDWVAVITPPCHVSTAQMFSHPELTRNTPRLKIGTLEKGENDFAPLVCRHYPAVEEAMKWLSDYGKPQLSGSGASVFACFEIREQAQTAIKGLPKGFKGFVAKSTNISPLHEAGEKLGFKVKKVSSDLVLDKAQLG